MFNTKQFLQFQNTTNANERDKLFLSELDRSRTKTGAKFVCFSLFDFTQAIPNQKNYATSPADWVRNYLATFNREIDPLSQTDFREVKMLDWREFRDEAPNGGRSRDLQLNIASLSHRLERERYGVLSLGFQTSDAHWPVQKACSQLLFRNEAKHISKCHEETYNCRATMEYKITRRESQCLRWVAMGKTDQQIAHQLGVATSTVVRHMKNIRRKLESPNRASAVAIALTSGIITM